MTLSYFYWRIFVLRTAKNTSVLDDIIGTSRGLEEVHDKSEDNLSQEQKDLATHLYAGFGNDVEEDVDYVAKYCFDKWPTETMDMDYVLCLAKGFDEYYLIVQQLVDQHTTTFSFGQMDPMDQALFVLGYEEHKLIETPKKIIINEIVELAKRYGDKGSPKLLHGIIHHLLTENE